MECLKGVDAISIRLYLINLQQNRYIITQFPQRRTMVDFWRMVWEQNVTTIIMLAPLNEMKMVHILLGFCYMYDLNKFYH